MYDMQNKVAIVTGGSLGIGQATALAFAREGAAVVVADVDQENGQNTVEQITGDGGQAHFVRVDVSKADQVQQMVRETVDVFGRLDYACNNAGIGGKTAPIGEYPEEDWQRVININLTGVWLGTKYEIQQMLHNGGGAIVNMASILGEVGIANSSAYVAAKHGVIGLTRAAALEYSDQGIRINAVCPAFIITPMLEAAGILNNPDLRTEITNRHPIGRLGQPDEVAETVLWLCSDAASFVTGHAMLVDGAYTVQ
ncbi:MAG: SDR family oxidoreductase [Chloroflexi bacterium]|nr:SDR family oxidoreductase [Chloroflexota bacterium]